MCVMASFKEKANERKEGEEEEEEEEEKVSEKGRVGLGQLHQRHPHGLSLSLGLFYLFTNKR